jgi:hypothetical protein
MNFINFKILHIPQVFFYLSNKTQPLKYIRKLQAKNSTQFLINQNKSHNVNKI